MGNPAQCMEPQVIFFIPFEACENIRTLFKVVYTLLVVTSGFSVPLIPIQTSQMGIKILL